MAVILNRIDLSVIYLIYFTMKPLKDGRSSSASNLSIVSSRKYRQLLRKFISYHIIALFNSLQQYRPLLWISDSLHNIFIVTLVNNSTQHWLAQKRISLFFVGELLKCFFSSAEGKISIGLVIIAKQFSDGIAVVYYVGMTIQQRRWQRALSNQTHCKTSLSKQKIIPWKEFLILKVIFLSLVWDKRRRRIEMASWLQCWCPFFYIVQSRGLLSLPYKLKHAC